ncbi:MAG: hypothetical protein LBQ54_09850 [Planctomycetaceae bacterium]|jgi:hypothetical protein|nr:hypothetical protein [Planctomycetaceae bacterium]
MNRWTLLVTVCVVCEVLPLFAQSEAYIGSPFGVGCAVLKMPPKETPRGLGMDGILLFERNNRIFYPVVEQRKIPTAVTDIFQNSKRPVGRLLGDILEQETGSVAVYFLFDGRSAPLNLSMMTVRENPVTVTPKNAPRQYQNLLKKWWEQYNKNADRPENDYPPVVSEYLLNMLSYRLGLPRAETRAPFLEKLLYEETGFSPGQRSKLFDAERARFFAPEQFQFPADQKLPVSLGDLIPQQTGRSPVVSIPSAEDSAQTTDTAGSTEEKPQKPATSFWSSVTQKFSAAVFQGSQKVSPNDPQKKYEREGIESMAFHVPPHCFYIRFGSFRNFLWFQNLTELWGGDMRNLIAMRAFKNGGNSRFETELAVKQDALAELFGNSVIEDIAVIGTDLDFDEGGSFGLLFKAKNNTLLANEFRQKRKNAVKNDSTLEEKTLKTGGHEVSFLSAPDHHVRSFYAAVGDYHLVSRSEKIMRDFIALHTETEGISVKHPSLGELAEFQNLRAVMPPDGKDTIFIYFSRPYFYNLTSASYWIETRRRNQAAAGIDLLKLGSLAAAGEGGRTGNQTVPQWVNRLASHGYIPQSFGPLPDGSRTVFRSWSDVSDSARGYRGRFLPVADHLAVTATSAEVQQYQQMCRDFFANWGNLDPLAATFRHTPAESEEGKMERITIDIHMAPLSRKNAETLRQTMGEPMTVQFGTIAGNIASFEISLKEKFFFGGLQNSIPPQSPGERPRLPERITSAAILQGELFPRDLVSGYMGLAGTPGTLLQLMDIGFPPYDDAAGYARGITGGWRRHAGPYTLYSQQRELLDRISPQLGLVPAEIPAQFRLKIQNLNSAAVTPVLNNLGFARTRNTSKGNALLLNQLHMQFHVNGPECKNVAEELLLSEMVCPLGGEYRFQTFGQGTPLGFWTSTALEQSPDDGFFAMKAPAGFVSPPLNWFRGLQADALLAPDAVSIHADLLMLLP